MGRIADALQRVHDAKPDEAGLPTGDRFRGAEHDLKWYGAARNESSTLDGDVDAHTSSGPPVEGLASEIITYYDPTSVVSEQYRSLRTRLLSANPHQEHRIFAVTSAVSRDGKSMTTLNLAFTLAEIRHLRILVVDGDLRKGTLGRSLNIERSPGLADVMRGDATYDQVIHRTPAPNLYFVPAGRTQGRSAPELLIGRCDSPAVFASRALHSSADRDVRGDGLAELAG